MIGIHGFALDEPQPATAGGGSLGQLVVPLFLTINIEGTVAVVVGIDTGRLLGEESVFFVLLVEALAREETDHVGGSTLFFVFRLHMGVGGAVHLHLGKHLFVAHIVGDIDVGLVEHFANAGQLGGSGFQGVGGTFYIEVGVGELIIVIARHQGRAHLGRHFQVAVAALGGNHNLFAAVHNVVGDGGSHVLVLNFFIFTFGVGSACGSH